MSYAENTSVPFERSIFEKQRAADTSRRCRDKKRSARRAALELERASRPQFTVAELAWAAGHFEGEGTCTVTRSGGHHTSSFVDLTSTDREVIDFFQSRWSATSVRTVPANERHKAKYSWRLSGERMRNFLLDVQPYLVTEKRKKLFALAIEIYDARRRGSRDPNYPAMMNAYREQVAALNRKGPIAIEYQSGRPDGVAGLLGGPSA